MSYVSFVYYHFLQKMNKGEHIKGLYIVTKSNIQVLREPVHIGYMIGNVLSDSEKSLLYPDPASGCYLIELASKGMKMIYAGLVNIIYNT